MRLFPFLARRAVQLAGVLTGICVVTFLLLHMAPGDPVRLLVGERASAETIAAIREQYGLDQPLWRQFAAYVANLAAGDIGLSIRFQRPVAELIGNFMWPTLFANRLCRLPGGAADGGPGDHRRQTAGRPGRPGDPADRRGRPVDSGVLAGHHDVLALLRRRARLVSGIRLRRGLRATICTISSCRRCRPPSGWSRCLRRACARR